jgi:outer membrane biosynthesis protein TonB
MVKEKDNNKKSSLSEFQRYIRGEMTKREENSFLRKYQNDPFAEEEAVSYSGILPGEAVDDKDSPGKQFKNWIKSRKRMVFISTAALVAVLIVISSVFIILDRNKTATQPIKDIVKPVPPEVTDSNQITGLLMAGSKNIPDTMGIAVKQEITNNKIDTAISAGTVNSTITENTKAPAMTRGNDSNLYIAKNQTSTPAVESGMQEMTALNVRGKIVSMEYGMSKKTDNKQSGYIYPQPVAGISNFNRYIEENMIKPLAQTQAEDSVVVVSFMVRTTGTIDSIKVINSPGDEIAREAIKLIREGPAWKPAENNGQTIDDEVRVRIVIK